jgi:molybdopterin/thiamine biosynthesis adenylyltransferase
VAPEPVAEVFARNLGSLTAGQQQTLQASTVAVIGCGGLGGFVVEELARLGIGELRICDPDRFDTTNINRQLYAGSATLGRSKAETAARRIREIHDHCTAHGYGDTFQQVGKELLTGAELACDCLDSPVDRLELGALCAEQQIPLVHGAVDRWYGQVAVLPPGSTLLHELYRGEQKLHAPPSVPVPVAALVASLQVNEICKLLLGMESQLMDTWMSIDLQRLTFDIF